MAKKWEIALPDNVSVDGSKYTMNGKQYVRVTRTLGVIAKPGLLTWFQRGRGRQRPRK